MIGWGWCLAALAQGPGAPDRTAPPPVLPATPLALPEPAVYALGPGVEVRHVRIPSVRKVAVEVLLGRGEAHAPEGREAAARAMGALLEAGGAGLGPRRRYKLADLHEIDLQSWLGVRTARLSLTAPRHELEVGLSMLEAVLERPRFPRRELRRHRRQEQLRYLVQAPTSPATTADLAVSYAWFPPDHPYGRRPDLEAIGSVRRREVRRVWAWWAEQAPVTVFVVGDVAWEAVQAPLRRALAPVGVEAPEAPALDVVAPQARVVAVAMPGQEQAVVRLRLPAPPLDHPDQPRLRAAQWALGGHFLSRLNRILREERDYTYGATAAYHAGIGWGALTVEVAVDTSRLAETWRVLQQEVARLREAGVTDDELAGVHQAALQVWNRRLLRATDASALYVDLWHRRHTVEDARRQLEALGSLDGLAVAAAARRWLEGGVWVVVGDRAKIAPQLKALDVDPDWGTSGEAVLGGL